MPLERMWAGWRDEYVAQIAHRPPDADLTLFEAILESGRPDRETGIVARGPTCFAILNRYPYASGHLLILPRRAVPDLAGLTPTEASELWATVHTAAAVLDDVYHPDGLNIGANLGRGAGAGIPGHLHVHVVPRWAGDTNFTVSIAETKVMPEALDVTWERVSAAWPS